MSQSIVFDLDGTLITCENKHKYVLYSILNRNGYTNHSLIDEWWTLKRNGLNTQKALYEIGISSHHQIAQEWARMIEDFTWCSLDKPFNDSFSTLEFLKEKKKST